ncbi:ABC transporter permease [Alsobacter sp. KACC 23698]|uniref:ABC transporter permease n=1 Tax=Alsobacter sp. KACC 23698 TaxID=3149229 RepID=A0AAU7JIY4_9HYPH
MTLADALLTAFVALRVNALRSCLTMLGVTIGVASVVTVLAIGAGAQAKVAEQIRALGANVLMIVPGASRQGGVTMKAGSRQSLTQSDADAIVVKTTQVRAAAPSVSGQAQIVRDNKNWNTVINGTTASHFIVRDWPISAGRSFYREEESAASKVAILGSTTAKELFGDQNAIGRQIRILNVPFEVIGQLKPKGQDQDDVVFVPIATAKLRFLGAASEVNRDAVAYILVKVTSDEALPQARREIEELLRERHRIRDDLPSDFQVTDPAAAITAQRGATQTIALLLAAIASVSLLVGGVSIMNIMIVSVTERTREIGIRRAVGARGGDIRKQFLCEAFVLCLTGGVLGSLIGGASASVISSTAGWPTSVSIESIVLSLGFSGLVGLFFGFYPAHRASKVEPVEALKS